MRADGNSLKPIRLLESADVVEPLTPEQLVDANAILFGAGHEADPGEVTVFAYYHRKRLTELVEHPAVDSDFMLKELFDTLPEKIEQQGLLPRLKDEVEEAHRYSPFETSKLEALQRAGEEIAAVKKEAPVEEAPKQKQLAKVAPGGDSGTLFPSEFAAINAEPSTELIKLAKKFKSYDDGELWGKHFGHILRVALRQNKALKGALMTPAIIEIIAELPVMLLIENTYGKVLRKRFVRAMAEEYPHLEAPSYSRSDLKGGTPTKYANAILGAYSQAEQEVDKGSGTPPTPAIMAGAPSEQLSFPEMTGHRLTPLLEMPK